MSWHWRLALIALVLFALFIVWMVIEAKRAPVQDPYTGDLVSDEEFERRKVARRAAAQSNGEMK